MITSNNLDFTNLNTITNNYEISITRQSKSRKVVSLNKNLRYDKKRGGLGINERKF